MLPTIYIVEDEPIIALSIQLMLKNQGYFVTGYSGEYLLAITEIEQTQPNLVIIDIKLEGEKTGIDVAKHLDTLNISHVYLSSLADPITQQEITQTHSLGFIDKPFTYAGLSQQMDLFLKSA